MMPQENFLELASAVRQLGNEDPMVRVNRESAQVEDLVMKRTEGDSVGLSVRTSCLVPLDVGCIQSDGHIADAKIETAQRAAILVGDQHPISESGISGSTGRRCALKGQTNRVEDVLMESFRKVRREKTLSHLCEKRRISEELAPHLFREASHRMTGSELSLGWIRIGSPRTKMSG